VEQPSSDSDDMQICKGPNPWLGRLAPRFQHWSTASPGIVAVLRAQEIVFTFLLGFTMLRNPLVWPMNACYLDMQPYYEEVKPLLAGDCRIQTAHFL